MEFLDFIKTQNESLYQVIFMRLHSEDVRLLSSLASLYLASSGTGILPTPNDLIVLAKPHYKDKNGQIKKGIKIKGKYYIPKDEE